MSYTFNDYQKDSRDTAVYPEIGGKVVYPVLGLVGESGEVAEKIKKIFRNDDGIFSDEKILELKKELGDVLWYLSQVATELGLDLDDIAKTNIEKLQSRKKRGVLKSEGDNR